jgi:CRP-like cAMP-binding protein
MTLTVLDLLGAPAVAICYGLAFVICAEFFWPTRIWLKQASVTASVAAIVLGVVLSRFDVVALHLAVLTMSLFKLRQVTSLLAHVRGQRVKAAARLAAPMPAGSERRRMERPAPEGEANEKPSMDWLTSSMTRRVVPAGSTLFRAGDSSAEMFMIESGTVHLVEVNFKLGAGDMIGEIGIFSAEQRRTATAICDTDVVLLGITSTKVFELYCQSPQFGLQIMQMIINRLNERVASHMAERRAAERKAEEEKMRQRLSLADSFEASVQRVFSGVNASVSQMQFCATNSLRSVVAEVADVIVVAQNCICETEALTPLNTR